MVCSWQELQPILNLLVDFGRKQPDVPRSSPVASSSGSNSAGGATPLSPTGTGGSGGNSGGSSPPHAHAHAQREREREQQQHINRRLHRLLLMSSPNGLSWLDLAGNALGDTGAATLVRLLSTSGNTRLRGLDLSNNRIVDGDKLVAQLAVPMDLVTAGGGGGGGGGMSSASPGTSGGDTDTDDDYYSKYYYPRGDVDAGINVAGTMDFGGDGGGGSSQGGSCVSLNVRATGGSIDG